MLLPGANKLDISHSSAEEEGEGNGEAVELNDLEAAN